MRWHYFGFVDATVADAAAVVAAADGAVIVDFALAVVDEDAATADDVAAADAVGTVNYLLGNELVMYKMK